MNYRHIYHAGNLCDVVKHAVLTLVLERLREKEKPFAVLDTHAGIGLYDLADERAQKTKEAEQGVLRFLAASAIPALASYDRIVRDLSARSLYPGSPYLIRSFLREQDRLMACELHPEDVDALKKIFTRDNQVHIHHRDAYEAIAALCPPPEKRGLVLIDPPYEKPDEYEALVQALAKLHARWAQAMVMVWYPIKDRPALWKFHDSLMGSGIPKILAAEFIFGDEMHTDRLNGSGLIIINPPWGLDRTLEGVFPCLHEALETEHRQSVVKWLVPDEA